MKIRLILILITLIAVCPLMSEGLKEAYFGQKISTPNGEIDFNVFLFHQKYKRVESKSGGYTYLPLVSKNNNIEKPFEWKDYKVYVLLKDGTLFHNYTTKAQTGNFACRYTVIDTKHSIQNLCYTKKFEPEDIDRIWIKLTDANFIKLKFFPKK